MIGVGVVGVIGGGTVGPPMGEILFGKKFDLGHTDLALLAAGSGLFILALTLAQALIALIGHAKALVAWVLGIAVFLVATVVTGDHSFVRVDLELSFIAGAAASAAMMGWMLLRQMALGVPEDSLARLAVQLEHEPLEI